MQDRALFQKYLEKGGAPTTNVTAVTSIRVQARPPGAPKHPARAEGRRGGAASEQKDGGFGAARHLSELPRPPCWGCENRPGCRHTAPTAPGDWSDAGRPRRMLARDC